MNKITRVLLFSLLAAILMLTLGVGACAPEEEVTPPPPEEEEAPPPPPEEEEAPPKTLKIGGVAMLSGPASQGGLSSMRGWELAIDKVNEEGGLKIGTDTYMLELIVEDDKMSAEGAATATTKLVYEDEVKFVIGGLVGFLAAAIYSVTSETGALQILPVLQASGALGHPADVAPGTLKIRALHAYDETYPDLFDYLVRTYPDVKTVGLMTDEFPDNDPLVPRGEEVAAEYGLTVVGEAEHIPADATDFYPIVSRVLQHDPDAIFILNGGPNFPGMVLKVARELQFTGPVVYAIMCDPAMQRMIAGPDSTDLSGAAITVEDPNLPTAVQEFMARYQATYSMEEFMTDSLNAYNDMWVLLQTIEKAQSIDPQAVMATYESLTEPGSLQTLYGPAQVGGLETYGVNRVIVAPIPIGRLTDGVAENVEWFTPDIP